MTFLKLDIISKKFLFNLSIVLFSSSLINASFFTNPRTNSLVKNNEFLLEYLSIKYPDHSFENFIYVGVKRQELDLYLNGNHITSYPVSTSTHGAGTKSGSDMTPIGLHKIKGKFGSGVPIGGILKARKYNGNIASIQTNPIKNRKRCYHHTNFNTWRIRKRHKQRWWFRLFWKTYLHTWNCWRRPNWTTSITWLCANEKYRCNWLI